MLGCSAASQDLLGPPAVILLAVGFSNRQLPTRQSRLASMVVVYQRAVDLPIVVGTIDNATAKGVDRYQVYDYIEEEFVRVVDHAMTDPVSHEYTSSDYFTFNRLGKVDELCERPR